MRQMRERIAVRISCPYQSFSVSLGAGDFLQGLRYGFKQLGVLERIGWLQLRLFFSYKCFENARTGCPKALNKLVSSDTSEFSATGWEFDAHARRWFLSCGAFIRGWLEYICQLSGGARGWLGAALVLACWILESRGRRAPPFLSCRRLILDKVR